MKKLLLILATLLLCIVTKESALQENNKLKISDLHGTWCIYGRTVPENGKWVVKKGNPYASFRKIKITSKEVTITKTDGNVFKIKVDDQTAYFDLNSYFPTPSFTDENYMIQLNLINKDRIEYTSDGEYSGGDIFEKCN